MSRCSGRTGGSLISVSSRIPWPGRRPRPLPNGVHAALLPCGGKAVRQSLTPARACCRGSRIHREKLMNYYGEMARDHWARWLPGRYAAIEDPGSFFSDLGSQAEERIDALARKLKR